MSKYGRGLRPLAVTAAVVLAGAFALTFFWAPVEADQGWIQKIFYLHVPMAIVALVGFVVGAWFALKFLRSGDRSYDLKSYVVLHQSIILAIGVLITGSIWGKASWGTWWDWSEPMLVAFLIIFLLFACYWPLRFSIEDPERQARYAAVFALIGGVFAPINFAAVRMAEQRLHPQTFEQTGGGMPAEMMLTFLVALAGMALFYVTLVKYELAAKNTSFQLKALKRRLVGTAGPRRRSAAPQLMAPTVHTD